MKRTNRFGLGFYAFFLVSYLSLSCVGELDLPSDSEWISDHFIYFAREEDPSTCVATLESLERHFDVFQDYLGFPWRTGDKIDYYKFVDRADYRSNSASPNAAGCMVTTAGENPRIHAYVQMEQHELIHAYLYSVGKPPDFLVEGMAHSLAPPLPISSRYARFYPGTPTFDISFEEAISTKVNSAKLVHQCKWWTGYLLKNFGPEAVMTLYHSWNEEASVTQVDELFLSVIGVSATEIWSRLQAGVPPQAVQVPIWQCTTDPAPLDGTLQSMTPTCETPNTSRTIDLFSDSDLQFIQTAKTPLRIGSCHGDPVPDTIIGAALGEGQPTIVHLRTGRYFIETDRPYASAQINILQLPDRVMSKTCSETNPIPLDENTTLHVPADGEAWFMKISSERPRRIAIKATGQDPEDNEDISLEVCDDCRASLGTCRSVYLHNLVYLDREESVLKITGRPERDEYVSLSIFK